jgi:hypothetical protein
VATSCATAADATDARRMRARKSERLRLIDEHDGDIVFDGVDQAALTADEDLVRLEAMLELTLAPGANEDREQVRRKAHRSLEVAM